MANPIMQQLSKTTAPAANNPMQMLQQFQKFRQQFTPQSAKAKVEELMKSGKISQEQFENLKGQAQNFMAMLGK